MGEWKMKHLLKTPNKTKARDLCVKATCLLADDNRGVFVLIKVKSFEAVKSVAVALSDLNTDRLYRVLGKFGIPLLSAEARETCTKQLQRQIVELVDENKVKPISVAKFDHLELPLS
jgi:hypothetical protein